MARSAKTASVVLKDRNDARMTGIRILEGEDGQLAYAWDYAPALAPTVPPADVSYGSYTPDQEITWSQNNWSDGGLKFYWENGMPDRYALSDKVWASTRNEVSLAPDATPIAFGVQNGTAELGENSNGEWTVSGVTLTVVTTDPYSGKYHFQMAGTAANEYIQHALENASRWQGKTCYVIAKVKAPEAGGTMRVQIIESGGSSTPTTNGSTVTLSTSYQTISAAVVVQADTTGINIRITCAANSGDAKTVYVDQVQALLGKDATNLEEMNANGVRMLVLGSDIYAVTQRGLYKFVESTLHWSLQYASAADITGAEVYDNRIYLGLGTSDYVFSDAGDATTMTVDNSGSKTAIYFAKTLNKEGEWALAKTVGEGSLHLSTAPTATAVWGSATDIGKNDRTITNVFNMNGLLAVGKEDGLYMYRYQDGIIYSNSLQNMYPSAETAVDTNNFSRGLTFNGWFYTVFSEVGLIRYNGEIWQDISDVIQSPGLSEVGNRVRAFGTDGRVLYLVVEDLAAASITKTCFVYSLRENYDGTWAVHIIASMKLSDAIDMSVFKPSNATNRHLFINGSITSKEPAAYRLQLPDRTDTPRLATNKNLALSGTLITSYWDGNRPQVPKAFNKLTLVSEDLSSSQTISVAYQVDNDTSWTNINSSNATFNSSPSGTIGFNEGVVGKRIRLRFTLSTTSATASPVIKGFALHMSWRPPRVKRWQIVGAVEDDVRLLQGVRHALPGKRMLTNLRSLAEDVSPIAIEDIDGEEHRAHIVSLAETQFKVRTGSAGTARYSRAVTMTLIETVGGGWGFLRWNQFNWE